MESAKQIDEKIKLKDNRIYNSYVFSPFADCHLKTKKADDFDLYGVYMFRLDVFEDLATKHFSEENFSYFDIFNISGKPNLKNRKVKEYILNNDFLSLYIGKAVLKSGKMCSFFLTMNQYYDKNIFKVNGFSVKINDDDPNAFFFNGPYCKLFNFNDKKNKILLTEDTSTQDSLYNNIKTYSDNTVDFLKNV